MRLLQLGLGLLLVFAWTSSARANTISFGTPTNLSTCSTNGNSADRSCTSTASVTNGALDAFASANVRGQASADHGITTNDTAIADITVRYQIPYTVTRTVTVQNIGGDNFLIIPNQQITFNLTFSGEVAKDNSQTGGGLGQALLDTGSFTVSSGRFGSVLMGGDISQTGGGGLARTPFNRTSPDLVGTAGRNFDGAAGEISFSIPTDYRDWEDFVAPFAMDYPSQGDPPVNLTQSFTDTLTISFRLRAESRPSGSVSTTGGEAIACAGLTSPLGGFDLDDGANCGSGLLIEASVVQTGTTSEPVPEPTTLGLLGLGLAGVAAFGARRRRK